MRRAVILNDTRGHHHFGCHRVMETIDSQLEARGFEIAARSLVRQRWWKNERFLKELGACDLIVINGEGTLHHGSRHGPLLLQIAEHPLRGSKPIALVNALYQENPQDWKRYLDRIDYINARDARSARELESVTEREVHCTLDLSLYSEDQQPLSTSEREGVVLGDSVVRETNSDLVRIARATPDAIYMPIVRTMKSSKPQHGPVGYALREAYVNAYTYLFRKTLHNAKICKDHREYCNHLRAARLHLTGRFHGVCLSIATRTPFLAFPSNSWKVEALLDDIGFDRQRRMQAQPSLGSSKTPEYRDFTDAELALLDGVHARVRRDTHEIFDTISSLTPASARAAA